MERTLGFLLLLFALAGSQPAELLHDLFKAVECLARLLGG